MHTATRAKVCFRSFAARTGNMSNSFALALGLNPIGIMLTVHYRCRTFLFFAYTLSLLYIKLSCYTSHRSRIFQCFLSGQYATNFSYVHAHCYHRKSSTPTRFPTTYQRIYPFFVLHFTSQTLLQPRTPLEIWPSHIPSPGNHDSLPIHITKQRTRHR